MGPIRRISGLRGVALLLTSAFVAPVGADSAFRCGSKLIEIGMSQDDVLSHCGEPMTRADETQPVRSGPQVTGTTVVSRWTYESYRGSRVLVFDADKLMAIE